MKTSCLNLAYNLLSRNLNHLYHMYRADKRNIQEKSICGIYGADYLGQQEELM